MCSKVKDFLTDDDFINYILGVTPQSTSHWESYFENHPEQIVEVEEAKAILLAPVDIACDFTIAESQELGNRIMSSIKGYSEKE